MALASWLQLADEPKIEETSVLVDGRQMHYLKTGQGPALVLIHGLLGTADAWRPCLPRLAEESSVYAVDTLGIGRSERVAGLDASLIAEADRMSAFLVQAGINRADIVGTSHGGSIAMMLAARHPEQARSLVLHAPANPFSDAADPLVRFYKTPLGHWFAHRVPYLPERLQKLALGRMYGNSKLVRHEALECYMGSLRMPGTTRHVLNILDSWFDDMRELEAVLEKLCDVPTLLVWGTQDRAVSLESGRKLEKMLRRAEMVMLPGVGHLAHDEAPLLFADEVNSFLRGIDRGELPAGPRLVRSNH